MSKIRIALADDSAFMRKALERMFAEDDDFEVVALVSNGEEAVEVAIKKKPDILLLDVQMPRMDGLVALENIMKQAPMPVIMVSSLTSDGAATTIKALELGAVDFISKDISYGSAGMKNLVSEIKGKIRALMSEPDITKRLVTTTAAIERGRGKATELAKPVVSVAQLPTSSAEYTTTAARHTAIPAMKKIVLIGVSTGGPQSLQSVIPFIPNDIGVPIILVQHIPVNFTLFLAERLNSISSIKVVEAKDGDVLEPNVVYIAKSGYRTLVNKKGNDKVLAIVPPLAGLLYNPSVDDTFSSVVDIYGGDTLGVVMTGMGKDGALGCEKIKAAGGFVISQDEKSSIVFGMPNVVISAGLADEIVSLTDLAARIDFHINGTRDNKRQ
ncbi:chemotaxis response regulator protein-glutamate methylesterase [Deferribacterales bacterium RsTz2092]|nr:chemotaxis response regulator protein-glutamate methylesterase [Deferribacterales bacterium]